MRFGEPLHDGVLPGIQVLELVHQEVVPSPGDLLGDLLVSLEQLGGPHHDVVEVDQVPVLEVGAILMEERQVSRGERVSLGPMDAEAGEEPAAPLFPHPEAA